MAIVEGGRGAVIAQRQFATLRLFLAHDLPAAEARWRALEADATMTPYQRFDWINALREAGADRRGEVVIAFWERDGVTEAMLPLLVRTLGPLRVARLIGSHHGNTDALVLRRGVHWSATEAEHALHALRQTLGGLDLVSIYNQREAIDGVPSPFLPLNRTPAASNLYTATIGPTPVPFIDHRVGAKLRSNLKRGRRRLEEQFGPVRLERVVDGDRLALVHRAFLDQRGERFAAMGVPNIFERPVFRRLFLGLAAQGFASDRPALVFHALWAGDTVVATSCGTLQGRHYSQYINSTVGGPAAKYSLSGILVAELMDQLTVAGIETFDMGLGDFPYKTDWCAPEPVFHSVIPLTLRGRGAVGWLQGVAGGKRLVKQTPVLWDLARRVRAFILHLRALAEGPRANTLGLVLWSFATVPLV